MKTTRASLLRRHWASFGVGFVIASQCGPVAKFLFVQPSTAFLSRHNRLPPLSVGSSERKEEYNNKPATDKLFLICH